MSTRAIETHGADVEAAIEAGLQQLGLSRADVIVEVVEEGRKGILGLGSKEATVRLTPLTIPSEPPPTSARPVKESVPAVHAERPMPAIPVEESPRDTTAAVESPSLPRESQVDIEGDEELESVVTDIVSNLLQKMGFDEAKIRIERSEPDDKTGRVMTMVRVDGDDLTSLIGPHGETLNNLQYVARLMAGHALRRRADFVIDVDGYRNQRKESLSSLARRMAQKAVERGAPVTLEPMSSYDRRIIHMALRDRDDVYTSSVGEGSSRRVRVLLKDQD